MNLTRLLMIAIVLLDGTLTFSAPLFFEHDSDNFIMRWAFQDICDHVFDPRTSIWAWPTTTTPGGARFNPEKVQAGDLIFVRNIELFIKEIHPLIRNPYVIITHGEYRDTCKERFLEYLNDETIIAWFSIHPPKYGHKKYFPIPLGLKQEKKYYLDKEDFSNYLKELSKDIPKTKLLYLNFDDAQNPERQILKKMLNNKTFCSFRNTPVPFADYLKEMAEYKFALSPRGWGPDCYRTWEALYVGTIPIVRRCQFDMLIVRSPDLSNIDKPGFENQYALIPASSISQLDTLYQELPILVVDDWEELTEEFLLEKYAEITAQRYSPKKLYMEYWIEKITQVRDDFLLKNKRAPRGPITKKEHVAPALTAEDKEALEVLRRLDDTFIGDTSRKKLALQSMPIKKLCSDESSNHYLLRYAFEPEEFYIQYYDDYFGGEELAIIQTDKNLHPVGKMKALIPHNLYKTEEDTTVAYVHDVFIKESERGKGLGKKIFEVGMNLLEKRSLDKIVLDLLDGRENLPAIKIYSKFGFVCDVKNSHNCFYMTKIINKEKNQEIQEIARADALK